jgi:hypothetical protein
MLRSARLKVVPCYRPGAGDLDQSTAPLQPTVGCPPISRNIHDVEGPGFSRAVPWRLRFPRSVPEAREDVLLKTHFALEGAPDRREVSVPC